MFKSCLALVILSTFSFYAGADTLDSVKRSQLEAAFIYQFTNYISWPNESQDSAEGQPFFISIVGQDDSLFMELEKLVKTKKIKNRPIVISNSSDLTKSHLVFVASTDVATLQSVQRKLRGNPTLIVSHGEELAKKGSMINFYLDEERLRFEINLNATKKENLQVSSQLLNLARLVND